MKVDRRNPRWMLLATLACTGLWMSGGTLAADRAEGTFEHCTPEMLEDAALRDVFFLDADLGWAVGDRGVIWSTEDGGRQWQRQRVVDQGQLESVHFIDARNGWVVGGAVHPYTHRTSCIVLRTQDGGKSWTSIAGLTLPALKYVRYFTAQQGVAVGNQTALYPTGIFRTEDGGRSWVTLPGGNGGQWTTADFRDTLHGAAAGFNGALSVISAPNVTASSTPTLGQRPLRAIRMGRGRSGYLVGDGGLVMQTEDAGLTWQNPVGALPLGVKDLFDFHAVAVVDEHVWIAGSPGSMVLHSADAGRTWELLRTDQSLPIHALAFLDPERGWAVGALGTILATRDGGRTWRRQHSGGVRVALLGIFSEARRIPLELFAQQSGDEGYLGYAEIINRRDLEIPPIEQTPGEDACHAAMSTVGGCGAEQSWRFPLRQEGLRVGSQELMEIWDRANDGRGVAMMEELMVRKIRQWRPEVLVTEAADPQGNRPLSHVINQLVLSAVTKAADSTSYPDHLASAGLQPWTVKKVFGLADGEQSTTVTLNTAQLATRLGRSLAEQAADAYSLVCDDYRKSPPTLGFQLLRDALPQSSGQKDIFSGIYLPPGGEARRQTSPPAGGNLETLMRSAQKRRNIEQIIETNAGASPNKAAWLGQVNDLTSSLSSRSGGQVLYQLAQQYRAAGRLDLAAQTLEQLIDRYPEHPLVESSLVWLLQYYASGEVGWQLQRQTKLSSQLVGASVQSARNVTSVRQAIHEQSIDGAAAIDAAAIGAAGIDAAGISAVETRMQNAGRTTTASAQMADSQRASQALHFARLIQSRRPQLSAEPWVQFPQSVAYRTAGMPRDAERFYHRLSSSPQPTDWGQCAAAELWLSHGRGLPPKTSYLCKRTAVRPWLDGQLTEELWQSATHLELTSAQRDDSAWPAAAMMMYDDQFLYLAVCCRRVPGKTYQVRTAARTRDPDLSDQDRVELYLDLDRDYTSFYRLTVDHRGCTGESCLGDIHWDPTWYVAQAGSGEDWIIEAAIPWSELTATAPHSRDVWIAGLQRVAPETGVQSFTRPAAVEPRSEGFALLMFE